MIKSKYILVPSGEDSHFKVSEKVQQLEQELGRVVDVKYAGVCMGEIDINKTGRMDKYKVTLDI